ncbi:MAG: hypothetical protein AAGA87_18140 [Pseudomonadota bacterium]
MTYLLPMTRTIPLLTFLALAACGADGAPEPVTEPPSFEGTIRIEAGF